MPLFDTYVMVDWSASNEKRPSKKPKKDAIWWAAQSNGNDGSVVARLREIRGTSDPEIVPASTGGGQVYEETRSTAIKNIRSFLLEEAENGRRVLVGFDFAFGYPNGFAQRITSQASASSMWRWLHERLLTPNRDRYEVAKCLNTEIHREFGEEGPFWDVGTEVRSKKQLSALASGGGKPPHNPYGKAIREWPFDFPKLRETDEMAVGAKPVWQLSGAGSVGSQAMLGMPWLLELLDTLKDESDLHGNRCVVWPFETGFGWTPQGSGPQITVVEIYPSLLRDAIDRHQKECEVTDCAQVRVNALAFSLLDRSGGLGFLFAGPRTPGTQIRKSRVEAAIREEGWIFGVDAKGYQHFWLIRALHEHFFAIDGGANAA